jgi:putative methanogen marker protein 4
MEIFQLFEKLAKKNCATIGIGSTDSKEGQKIIEKSISSAVAKGYGEVSIFNSPEQLISALRSGEVSCGIRGTLNAKETLGELKQVFNQPTIYRSALIYLDDKSWFFLAPVGIDEGIFIDERFQIIKLLDSLLKRYKIKSKTAIISGGRLDDFGRSGLVDESLRAGEKLNKLTKEEGLEVKHYGVLIEEAYKESNIIIAPNGIVGNLLFRTLHFLGSTRSLGAPILNLDRVFIDTSRSKRDYTDSIMMASALSRY